VEKFAKKNASATSVKKGLSERRKMYDLLWDLSRAVEELEIIRKTATIQQKRGPKGTLGNGYMYRKHKVYWKQDENGKKSRITITHDFNKQVLIAKKLVAEKQISDVEYAIAELKKTYEKIKAHVDFDYQKYCNKKFPWMDSKLIDRILSNYIEDDEWANEKFEQSAYRAEEKIKMTSRGLYVRSKSEVLIAEKLYEHKIPFRYEEVINVGKIQLVPDFTIKRSDGKIFYWEHMGMTNSESYIERQYKKLSIYKSADIVPWDNLIITFDGKDGFVDVRKLESEIVNNLVL